MLPVATYHRPALQERSIARTCVLVVVATTFRGARCGNSPNAVAPPRDKSYYLSKPDTYIKLPPWRGLLYVVKPAAQEPWPTSPQISEAHKTNSRVKSRSSNDCGHLPLCNQAAAQSRTDSTTTYLIRSKPNTLKVKWEKCRHPKR